MSVNIHKISNTLIYAQSMQQLVFLTPVTMFIAGVKKCDRATDGLRKLTLQTFYQERTELPPLVYFFRCFIFLWQADQLRPSYEYLCDLHHLYFFFQKNKDVFVKHHTPSRVIWGSQGEGDIWLTL